jgi:hypothetical protein
MDGEESGRVNEHRTVWCEKQKKRSSQASWKHAAWELLSPDLRCFCKHHVEKDYWSQEYLRVVAISNVVY